MVAEDWAQWRRTSSSPLFFCSCQEIVSLAVMLRNATSCKRVSEEGSQKRLHTSQECRKHLLKASFRSPCVNIRGVHICGCQHLYDLWMKESACSELGIPARQHWAGQAQKCSCSLILAPQKRKPVFLATEGVMTLWLKLLSKSWN